MRPYDIIRKKRDGEALSNEEIDFFIKGAASGEIPDYQASAFLMAVYLKGMDMDETVGLTKAMMKSGETLDFKSIDGPKVDKHSTGGVGDKTSIILAPLLASMGVRVPMVAGKSLGHTGGTIDKLSSIPGFRTSLETSEFKEIIKNIGASIMAQSTAFAPADKKLYSLRDVTATIESIPLISASIMAKKLCEGIDGLVLDVKTGSGAFMKSIDDSRRLGRAMVEIGLSMGVKTVAVMTDMGQPLGRTVGNSLEVKECITALKGKGAEDLMEVTLTLAAWMLNMSDAITEEVPMKKLSNWTLKKYKDEAFEFIERGDAFKKFVEMIDAQGGDPEVAFNPSMLQSAKNVMPINSPKDGYVRKLDAECVGRAALLLGAGREKADDVIDPAAGIVLNAKIGKKVSSGEPLAMLHYNDDTRLKDALDIFNSGVDIGDREIAKRPLVYEVVM